MKLINKDALVAEIERRIDLYDPIVGYEEGRKDEAKSILSFVSTLEVKEVDLNKEIIISENLEEAIKTIKLLTNNTALLTFEYGFRKGANWQKQQDQETVELAEDHAMLAGMEKMEQQMLSKAVDASCTMECNGNGTVCTKKIPLNGLRCGDTCKVIILKDE